MTIGLHISPSSGARLPRPLYVPLAAAMGLAVFALSLTPPAESFAARVVLFYLATSLAYGVMPYVRRGDIPLVAAWVGLRFKSMSIPVVPPRFTNRSILSSEFS